MFSVAEEEIKCKKRKIESSPLKSVTGRNICDKKSKDISANDLNVGSGKCKHVPLQTSEILDCESSDYVSSETDITKQILIRVNERTKQITELKETDIPLSIIKSKLKGISKPVSDDICKILAGCCSYKLRKVIKSSVDYMKHCGRTKFTAEDFNKGLLFCGEDLYIPCELLPVFQKERTNLKYTFENCSELQSAYITGKWLNSDCPLSKDMCILSDELQKYFNTVTRLLLNENEDMCSVVLCDFKTNKCIFPLVPYFINFLCSVMDKFTNDFLRMSILLKSVESLLSNPYLYFGKDFYLNMLTYSLLRFLFAHLPHVNQNKDCWLMKDTAANILPLTLKLSKSKQLFIEVISEIDFVLSNSKNSLVSHYGALAAVNSIGVPAILMLIPSYIDKYYKEINSMNASNYQEKYEICMVRGKVIHSYYLLMHHYFKYEFSKSYDFLMQHHLRAKFYLPDFLKSNEVFPLLSQLSFDECFDDSLVQGFPLNFVSYNMTVKKKIVQTIKSRRNFHFKNAMKKDSKMKNVHQSLSQIFDTLPLKNCKINFGKISGTIND